MNMQALYRSLPLQILLSACCALAADPKQAAVEAAERAWAEAVVKADPAAMDRVLAAELSYIHSDGRPDTKASYIDTIKAGKQKYEKVQHQKMTVHVYGNTAWVAARADVRAGTTQVSDVVLSFLHFWVFRDDRWQLAAHQSARVAK